MKKVDNKLVLEKTGDPATNKLEVFSGEMCSKVLCSNDVQSMVKGIDNVSLSEEANSFDEIDSRLFLGDKNAAMNLEVLSRLGLSHILTAELIPLPRMITSSFPNMAVLQVNVPDMPDADLLSEFEPACQFIEEGVSAKGILVHCYHGVSRSASLVIAYLMKTRKIGCSEALAIVQSKRPSVQPNSGFMRQLQLYEQMQYRLDPDFKPFKLYKLFCIYNYVRQSKVLPSNIRMWHSEGNSSTTNQVLPTNDGHKLVVTIYRCKKCRLVIGSSTNVLPHQPRQQVTWFVMLQEQASTSTECRQGVFMEPIPSTMSKVCQVPTESKLLCSKCDNKLGTFAWDRPVTCGCGASITPGFVLNLSRVDRCTVKKEVEAVI